MSKKRIKKLYFEKNPGTLQRLDKFPTAFAIVASNFGDVVREYNEQHIKSGFKVHKPVECEIDSEAFDKIQDELKQKGSFIEIFYEGSRVHMMTIKPKFDKEPKKEENSEPIIGKGMHEQLLEAAEKAKDEGKTLMLSKRRGRS